MITKLLWNHLWLVVALLNSLKIVVTASAKPTPLRRFIVNYLSQNSILQPNEIVSSMDWRYLNQLYGNRIQEFQNYTYYSTVFEIMGLQLTIKCTDLNLNRSVEAHCPGLHYLIKIFGIRSVFFTLGFLVAGVGTCKMAFSKRFEAKRKEVLRQIPLSRRDSAMSGFDRLRCETLVSQATRSSTILLYDTRETGQMEEVLKQMEST